MCFFIIGKCHAKHALSSPLLSRHPPVLFFRICPCTHCGSFRWMWHRTNSTSLRFQQAGGCNERSTLCRGSKKIAATRVAHPREPSPFQASVQQQGCQSPDAHGLDERTRHDIADRGCVTTGPWRRTSTPLTNRACRSSCRRRTSRACRAWGARMRFIMERFSKQAPVNVR